MKKQINPSIKAHLLWSALILLLLLAICAIPFALAQRNATRSVGNLAPNTRANMYPQQMPSTSNVSGIPKPNRVRVNPPIPAAPNVVLYDQINNPAPTPGGVTSQDFEAALDTFDSFAADDFVVPAGQTWNITEVDVAGEYSLSGGPAASFHVFFYSDSATLPGALVG